jgi:guanylate kinase
MTEPAQPRRDLAHGPRERGLLHGPRERGLLIVLSSPSGAGKTTLARRLLGEFDSLGFSVSVTTRPPREGERPGVDYHFVDRATFERMIEERGLAEWAEVHGNCYGTARAAVDDALAQGRDTLFDIDWQGARALAEQWPTDVLRIFVLPPSLAVLEARLRGRGTDDAHVIERRLRRAVDEMGHFPEYDYLVVNDDLDRAYATLRAIYLANKYGASDRGDVPHPLSELAERARASALITGEPAR